MTTGRVPSRPPVSGGWLWRPLLGATMSQLTLGIARPAMSYAAISLGAGAFEVGLITAVYAVLPMLTAIAVGKVGGRMRRIGVLPAGAGLLLVVACAVAALAPDLIWLATASALLGLGNLAVLVGAQAWIARSAPPERFDDAFGWMTAGMAAGQAAGPVIAGLLIGPFGSADSSGIATSFWVAAGAAILTVACFVSRATRDDRRDTDERTASTSTILHTRGVTRWMFTSAAVLASVDIILAYLPLIGEERGIEPVVVGAMLAVRGTATAVSRLALGALSRRWSRSTLLIVSTGGSAACLAAVAVVAWVPALFVLMAVAGFLLGIGQPLTMSAVAVALPPRSRSGALALRLLGNRVAQTATPLVAGSLAAVTGIAAVFWLQVVLLATSTAWEVAARRGDGDDDG